MTTPAADQLWSAIADPSRRRVLDLLVRHGEATASALATEVPFSRQAVSKHLVALEAAGLIWHHKRGREVLYRVRPDGLRAVTEILDRLANQWNRRLEAIKQLAEEDWATPSQAEAAASARASRPTAR